MKCSVDFHRSLVVACSIHLTKHCFVMLLWEIIEARPIQLTPTTERGTSSLAELNAPLATQLNGHNVCAIQLAEHWKKFYII